MIDKKFGKNVLMVIMSNGVKLLSSVLTMFAIPLLFSQQDYGFYKLYLLYLSYVGIFHFGFLDGIYLHYAGKEYDGLPKETFRRFTRFLLKLETIVVIIALIATLFMSGQRQTMLILAAINLIILNMTTYFQFISQVTERFKEFATRNIILTVLNVLLIGLFYFFKLESYILYIILTTLINLILLMWYLVTYKDITFGKANNYKKEKSTILLMFKIGIPLLLSNFIGIFMSNIPKQFVDMQYPIELYPDIFSNFSFAFTLLGFTSVFLTAIGLVLYPILKKSDKDQLKKNYFKMDAAILALVFILLTAFYPLKYIVFWLLPNYSDSIKYFFILAPGIALTSSISVIKHNYFKSYDKNTSYLLNGIISLVLLIGITAATYYFVSKEVIFIAISAVLSQVIWFSINEFSIQKSIGLKGYKNWLFIFISMTLFYVMYLVKNDLISMILYGIGILIISALFYSKEVLRIMEQYRENKRHNKQGIE